jgi:hypothetical protein
MKRLKAGPDLKLPDLRNLRVPGFLEDLYYDLKDRRLLPLVALAIVAIIAVPFLLSGGSSKPEIPAQAAGGGSSSASASGAAASLTVVRANPGLRDYRKRLRDRSPTDPFKQHFTGPDLAGAQLGSPGNNGFEESPSVSSSTSSSSTSIESTETSTTTKTTRNENGVVTKETETHPTSQGSPNSGEEEGSGGSEPSSVAFTIDVKIKTTTSATEGAPEATETETHSKTVTRKNVLAPAALPGEKSQAVTYMGVNPKTGEPLLLVSDEITSIFGEAKCLSGVQSCQLIEVEPGMPVTFVYGPEATRYKMTVLKVEPAGGKES